MSACEGACTIEIVAQVCQADAEVKGPLPAVLDLLDYKRGKEDPYARPIRSALLRHTWSFL